MPEGKLGNAYGFVLGDDFDQVLRHLSADYLQAAWRNLQEALRHEKQKFTDLRYGWLHSGVAVIDLPDSPIAYFGWVTNQVLSPGPKEEPFRELGRRLMQVTPKLQWGASYRGWDFGIEPENFAEGVQACIEIGTDEVTDWDPEYIVDPTKLSEPWRIVAKAIQDQDHKAFDLALEVAEASYSPDGFQFVRKGFERWNQGGGRPLR